MNQFKTPSEAIEALKTECELAWEEYCLDNNILREDHPQAFAIAKNMYIAGFQRGSFYVTSYLVALMPQKEFVSVPTPENKTIAEIDKESKE